MNIINTSGITQHAFGKLAELDESFIGTQDYMGLAYFWSMEFRHDLRPATCNQRKMVHNKFIKAGLPLDGATLDHLEIVKSVIKD